MNDTTAALSLKTPLKLSYKQNYIAIQFADTLAPFQANYQYRLHSVDWNWVNAGKRTEAIYSNLHSGEYTFWVRNTRRNEPPAQFYFSIEPAFWQHWWFVPLLFLQGIAVVGVVLYLLYLYRIRQFLRLQQTRDRIARDLHDDMGSYLSSISILSQSAQRSVTKDPAKAQATLDRIGQTARQVMDSMGDIVWSINPDHDSMTQVIARMSDVASALFATGNDSSTRVSCQFEVSDEVRQIRLSAENRRDFFLIYKEAITNAAKYAQASQVGVRLGCEGSLLCLEVSDNGRGFDPQHPVFLNPSGGNGLRNMQNRAALLNGSLTIQSEPGQGTTLTLRFTV